MLEPNVPESFVYIRSEKGLLPAYFNLLLRLQRRSAATSLASRSTALLDNAKLLRKQNAQPVCQTCTRSGIGFKPLYQTAEGIRHFRVSELGLIRRRSPSTTAVIEVSKENSPPFLIRFSWKAIPEFVIETSGEMSLNKTGQIILHEGLEIAP